MSNRAKITIEQKYDYTGKLVYMVRKSRGKLTLEEIQQALREAQVEGLAAIMFNLDCSYNESIEDHVDCDRISVMAFSDYDDCPVCSHLSPIRYRCPECGRKLECFKEGDM